MSLRIDGKKISSDIKEELKEQVKQLKEEGVSVCLAVIQVGNDPASSVYVNNKKKACAYIGIESQAYELPEETTQEELDASAKESGYKVTLNEDGSATYVMTKKQHKQLMEKCADNINSFLSEMVGSEDYPNITDVTANSDFTSYTITTTNSEPDLSETVAVMSLYMMSGMYYAFNGTSIDNVHVDFVNADSGEVISSSDSSDLASDSE